MRMLAAALSAAMAFSILWLLARELPPLARQNFAILIALIVMLVILVER